MTAAFYQNETKFYVAVDCIILGFDQKELNVLLYKRKFEPMMGQWSLMGGFIKAGESIEEAASRVLTDCTGIDNLFMEQVGAYGRYYPRSRRAGNIRSILFTRQYERFQ